MMIASRNGFAVKRNVLPSWLRRVEYLESTGAQYIDTGVIPTIDNEISVRFKYNSLTYGAWDCVSGVRTPPNASSTTITRVYAIRKHYILNQWNSVLGDNDAIFGTTDLNIHTVVFNDSNHSVHLDGNLVASFDESKFSLGGANLWIFASNWSPGYSYLHGRVYWYKIRNPQTDISIRDFVPVAFANEQSQDEGAMYDLRGVGGMNPDGSARNDGLYRNRGTGAFVIGPDV